MMSIKQFIRKSSRQASCIFRGSALVVTVAVGGIHFLTQVLPGDGIAFAQNTNATIRGQVLDPSGALVPNATVVIMNKETSVTVFQGITG